tara:strand:- start:368 stop:1573 length:1206 start_codon:yes stop_codon:yes gene_type:complete
VTLTFLVCRLINAAAISISIIGLALYFGAESWSSVVLIQTISAFLPFMSFGYNEGFGLRLPFREQLSKKLVPLLLINVVLSVFLTVVLLFGYLFYSFPTYYFILPLALVAILTFSLVRIYFRSLGAITQLSRLYLINAIMVFASAYGATLMQEAFWFLIFFHVSQLLSCMVAILLTDIPVFSGYRKSVKGLGRFILAMSMRGIPLMCSYLLFEAVMNADRLQIILADKTAALSLLGIALTISRGSYMILSVINTSQYKTMANLIRERNGTVLVRNMRVQMAWGFIVSLAALLFFFTVTNSSLFLGKYPSYAGVANYIFWQGLYITLFSIIVPLSTFCNLYYGGRVYFITMLMISSFITIFAVITANFDLSIWTFYAISILGLAVAAGSLFSRVKGELMKWN